MTKSWRFAVQLGLILSTFVLWEAVVRYALVDDRILPPPSLVASRLVYMLADPSILYNIWITAVEVMVAFVLVVPPGIAIGLWLGESRFYGQAFKPFFYFVANVPKSVFLPVFILTFGIGMTQKIAFGMFQAIFILVISSIAAADSVPADLVKMARSCGAKRRELYFQIYLPAMLPVIVEGLRLGMIFNITGVLFAEMYVSRAGLGHLVSVWGMQFQMPDLFAGIILAALMSIVINESLRWYERRVGSWRMT